MCVCVCVCSILQNVLHKGTFLPVEVIQLEGQHGNVPMPGNAAHNHAGSTSMMNPLLANEHSVHHKEHSPREAAGGAAVGANRRNSQPAAALTAEAKAGHPHTQSESEASGTCWARSGLMGCLPPRLLTHLRALTLGTSLKPLLDARCSRLNPSFARQACYFAVADITLLPLPMWLLSPAVDSLGFDDIHISVSIDEEGAVLCRDYLPACCRPEKDMQLWDCAPPDTASTGSAASMQSLARVQAHRSALAVRNDYEPPELSKRRHGTPVSVWTKP